MYGVADVHMEGEEKKIVVVMDAEGNAIGIIKSKVHACSRSQI